VAQLLRDNGIRVEIDNGDDTIGKKIRTHRKMQPAYMVILGDGEIESRSVSLRARNGDQVSGIPLDTFLTDLKREIEEKVSQPALAVNTED
jgi:threonyl-tRNA synthetase